MKRVLPIWARTLFLCFGAINIVFAVVGGYYVWSSVRWVSVSYKPHPAAPYFKSVFLVATVINVAVLVALVLAALSLLKLRPSGVAIHSATCISAVAYAILTGALWNLGPVGASIAAASGVGNMGIAPFGMLFGIPAFYPLSSTILLQFARWRVAAAPTSL
jgi:hypothetical protein